MRDLNSSALSAVLETEGLEPITVIGIEWIDGFELFYADKELPEVAGRILSMDRVSNTIDEDWVQSISEVNVTISDLTGEFRALFNETDLHKRRCTIYQTFTSLGVYNKFPLVPSGQITSPIVWDEMGRTVSFSVSTVVESGDAGFSSESGSLSRSNTDDFKDWPMCFGDVLYVPASEVDINPVGKLLTAFGEVDPLLVRKKQIYIDRNAVLFANYAAIIAYDEAVQNYVPPSAAEVLAAYINEICLHDDLGRQALAVLARLEAVEKEIAKSANDAQKLARLKAAKNSLTNSLAGIGKKITAVIARKESVRDYIQGIEYELRVHKENVDKLSAIIKEIQTNNGEITKLNNEIASQQNTERNVLIIDGGEKFPQNTDVEITIKDIKFKGRFSGNTFTRIDTSGLPKYKNLDVAGGNGDRFNLSAEGPNLVNFFCLVQVRTGDDAIKTHLIKVIDQQGTSCKFQQQEIVVPDPEASNYEGGGSGIQRYEISGQSAALLAQGKAFPIDDEERRNIISLEDEFDQEISIDYPDIIVETNASKFVVDGENIISIMAAAPIVLTDWVDSIPNEDLQGAGATGQLYIETGADVLVASPAEIYYICNIIDSDIVAVHAYKNTSNGKILTQVPKRYYTVHDSVDLNGLTVSTISLKQKLSSYAGLGWEDQLYVTLRSSIGPVFTDIVTWLLQKYTKYTLVVDSPIPTFSLWPMNFAVFGRQNVLDLIKKMAYQVRCGVFIKGTVVHIKYLSAEPGLSDIVDTISNSDILVETLKLEVTNTEYLNTKYIAKWKPNYLPDSEKQVILRHNISKYGTQEASYDYFAFTNKELVEKSATFWLIRKANSWKHLKFRTALTKLKLEPFDAININITTAVESINCVGVIESADIQDNNEIEFSVWLPIKVGTITSYELAFPSTVDHISFPTEEEIASGFAGSGISVEGTLTQIVEGTPVSSTRPLDWGKQNLWDSGDVAPQSLITSGGLFNIVDDIPAETNPGTFYVPAFPDTLRKITSTQKPNERVYPKQDAYLGFIIDGGPKTYTVMLHTGKIVEAEQVKVIDDDRTLVKNDVIYVIQGNSPDDYIFYERPPIQYTRVAKVVSIGEDFILCSSLDGQEDDYFYVAKGFEFWTTTYNIKPYNGSIYTAYRITNKERRLTKIEDFGETPITTTVYQHVSGGYYQPGDNIIIGYMPLGIESTIEGFTHWIDMNVSGKTWQFTQLLTGSITQDIVLNNQVPIVFNDGNPALVGCPIRLRGHKFSKNTIVVVALDIRTLDYSIISMYEGAQRAIGKANDDMKRFDPSVSVDVVTWLDGLPLQTTQNFLNPFDLECNEDDFVVADRRENGDYVITQVLPVKAIRIRFKLTANLTLGGSAAAVILEDVGGGLEPTNTVTVNDPLKIFKGKIGSKGYAEWKFDTKEYEIYQMQCKVVE